MLRRRERERERDQHVIRSGEDIVYCRKQVERKTCHPLKRRTLWRKKESESERERERERERELDNTYAKMTMTDEQ
jgi:hypothetical protein